jgi:TolB protein
MLFWFAALALAADPVPADNWQKQESQYLSNIRQITTNFARAGEGYFSPDGKKIIFQAEETKTGNPFYQIYVMDLASGRTDRVSPGDGKTTCAYFRPDGKKIIFASTHLDPQAKAKYAPELETRAENKAKGVRPRYTWDFDKHMDIFEADPDGSNLKRLTDVDGYDAEGSYSADGKQIVFCSQRTGSLELHIMNADGTGVRQLTKTPNCYNGGPFFSPDGKRVIFRSDRKEKDRLQIYVINADGTGERCLTEKPNWVCWAPFWYPDNKHVIYTGADHGVAGRPNYDLYWLDVESGKETRITFAPGADVLPVFSADGTKLMWTSTRDGRQPSQLYMADFMPPKSLETRETSCAQPCACCCLPALSVRPTCPPTRSMRLR